MKNYSPSVPQQSSPLETMMTDMMKLQQQFIQQQQQTNTAQAQLNQATAQAIAKMEVQLGQLAISVGGREKGQFPSQTVPNPKVQPNVQNALRGQFGIDSTPGVPHDEVQAIHTLRSGKQVDNQVKRLEERNVNEIGRAHV